MHRGETSVSFAVVPRIFLERVVGRPLGDFLKLLGDRLKLLGGFLNPLEAFGRPLEAFGRPLEVSWWLLKGFGSSLEAVSLRLTDPHRPSCSLTDIH